MEFNELMKALGEHFELNQFEADENGCYRICIDDIVVTFEERCDAGVLETTVKLCELPNEDENLICRVLLTAMAPGAKAADYTFFIASDGKSICMRRIDFLARLTIDKFLEILENFANAFIEWGRAIVNFRQALPTINESLENKTSDERPFGIGADGFMQI